MEQRPSTLLELWPSGRPVALGFCPVGTGSEDRLGSGERALWERGKTPKRRNEFLAGRLAARAAVEKLGITSECQVVPVTTGPQAGRPVLVPDVGLSLSITHAAGWAIAAAGWVPALGVDAEGLKLEVGPAFFEEALAPGELAGFERLVGVPFALSCAWTTKEAALKVWGVGLRAPLARVHVVPNQVRPEPDGLSFGARLEVPVELEKRLGPSPTVLECRWMIHQGRAIALAAPAAGAKP